jgi:hypothetical protein
MFTVLATTLAPDRFSIPHLFLVDYSFSFYLVFPHGFLHIASFDLHSVLKRMGFVLVVSASNPPCVQLRSFRRCRGFEAIFGCSNSCMRACEDRLIQFLRAFAVAYEHLFLFHQWATLHVVTPVVWFMMPFLFVFHIMFTPFYDGYVLWP